MMRINLRVLILLIIVLMLSLQACTPAPNPDSAVPSDAQAEETLADQTVISRDTAEQLIRDLAEGSDAIEIISHPELDQSDNEVLYYFIQTVYPNKMSASYFVDSLRGTVYVAFGGELDTSNPLSSPGQIAMMPEDSEAALSDGKDAPEITLTESSQISALLNTIGASKKEVERQFGKQYSNIRVSYNGSMEAFLYIDQSITFAFDSNGAVAYIYCSDKVDINGAMPGMNFSQIQDALGETEVVQTWVDTPEDTAYQLTYQVGNRTLIFFSRQLSGEHAILSIH